MENASASHDEQRSASGLVLLPVLLCMSAVVAVCIGVIVFVLSRDVPASVGISGVVVGVGASVSWWIAPRLIG
jgi:hypothetical protein